MKSENKSSRSKITISQIEDAIVQILQRTMGMEPKLIRSGTRFESIDANFDSLAFTELMICLEEELGFEMDQARISNGQKAPECLNDLAKRIHEEFTSFE